MPTTNAPTPSRLYLPHFARDLIDEAFDNSHSSVFGPTGAGEDLQAAIQVAFKRSFL